MAEGIWGQEVGLSGHKRLTWRLSQVCLLSSETSRFSFPRKCYRGSQPSGSSDTTTRSRPVGRQCHRRQEQRLQLAGQAGNLGILGFVRLDQAGKLKNTCEGDLRVNPHPQGMEVPKTRRGVAWI